MGIHHDWSVFLNTNHKGWILEAMAIESAKAIGLEPNLNYLPVSRREVNSFRLARNLYFPHFTNFNLFMHQDIFISISQRGLTPGHFNSVFVTHLTGKKEDYVILSAADLVLVQNKSVKETLIEVGVQSDKIRVVYGAVNHTQYFPLTDPDTTSKPFVLITSNCKPRKNPQRIFEVIRAFPELDFVIHGKGWNSFLDETHRKFDNLQVIDFCLEDNPSLMRKASTFLTLSTNEGGPIPLLEALASGTPCVATSTGFAPELLFGNRGYSLPIDFDLESVGKALYKSIKLKREVWSQDLLDGDFSWDDLGSSLYSTGSLP
jgi:glycosyltransferase involved in cell wall biosynthesis